MKKNIIANFFGKFWSVLSNFLFIPLYIKYLGFENYSLISFSLVIAGIMAVLDGGFTATISREFARTDVSTDEKKRVYKTIESCYFILALLCIILIFSFSDFIAFKWLNIKTLNPNIVSNSIRIIGFGIAFQMLLRFYLGGLYGLEKQVEANLYQIFWGIVRNGFVVIIIYAMPSIELFFIWQTFSSLFFAILVKIILNKKLSGEYFSNIKPGIEIDVLHNIRKFAGGMLLISFVASLNSQIDKLAISKLLSVENLGYYTLAVSISMAIYIVISSISAALLPRFTALYTQEKINEATRLFVAVNKYVGLLVFPLMVNLSFYSEEIIWIWTGNKLLASNASVYLPIISLSYSMLSISSLHQTIAIANAYTKINNQMGIISLLITLPGYWIFTKNFGGVGAAILFCIVQLIITLFYFYFIQKKFLLGVSLKSIYLNQMLYPFIVATATASIFEIISFDYYSNRFFTFLWISMSTVITFATTCFFFMSVKQIKEVFNFKLFFK